MWIQLLCLLPVALQWAGNEVLHVDGLRVFDGKKQDDHKQSEMIEIRPIAIQTEKDEIAIQTEKDEIIQNFHMNPQAHTPVQSMTQLKEENMTPNSSMNSVVQVDVSPNHLSPFGNSLGSIGKLQRTKTVMDVRERTCQETYCPGDSCLEIFKNHMSEYFFVWFMIAAGAFFFVFEEGISEWVMWDYELWKSVSAFVVSYLFYSLLGAFFNPPEVIWQVAFMALMYYHRWDVPADVPSKAEYIISNHMTEILGAMYGLQYIGIPMKKIAEQYSFWLPCFSHTKKKELQLDAAEVQNLSHGSIELVTHKGELSHNGMDDLVELSQVGPVAATDSNTSIDKGSFVEVLEEEAFRSGPAVIELKLAMMWKKFFELSCFNGCCGKHASSWEKSAKFGNYVIAKHYSTNWFEWMAIWATGQPTGTFCGAGCLQKVLATLGVTGMAMEQWLPDIDQNREVLVEWLAWGNIPQVAIEVACLVSIQEGIGGFYSGLLRSVEKMSMADAAGNTVYTKLLTVIPGFIYMLFVHMNHGNAMENWAAFCHSLVQQREKQGNPLSDKEHKALWNKFYSVYKKYPEQVITAESEL